MVGHRDGQERATGDIFSRWSRLYTTVLSVYTLTSTPLEETLGHLEITVGVRTFVDSNCMG